MEKISHFINSWTQNREQGLKGSPCQDNEQVPVKRLVTKKENHMDIIRDDGGGSHPEVGKQGKIFLPL